jgi:hypothetical protein
MTDFVFSKLGRADVMNLMTRTRAVVDIEHEKQSGLTMRTIETLGAARKLATTNPHIARYDFYTPKNIAILDRRAPRIPDGFLNGEYDHALQSAVRRHELSRWVSDVVLRGEGNVA